MCGKPTERNDLDVVNRETKQELKDTIVCPACARKYIVDKRKERYTGAMKEMFRLINNISFDHADYDSEAIVSLFFGDHRQLQADFLYFIMKILRKIGEKAGDPCWTDPRNEWAIEWAKKAGGLMS
jgi:hypothetical protein